MKNGFTLTPLTKKLNIEYLISVHYYEYPSTFLYEGESHDFWEFLYVDKGEVGVTNGNEKFNLKQGDIIFHKPNIFHDVYCNGKIAPNLLVVAFDCNDEAMNFFKDKIIKVNKNALLYLNTLISESKKTFSTNLADPYFTKLEIKKDAPDFSLDLIRLSLESFLIQLILSSSQDNKAISIHNKENSRRVEIVIDYLEDNIQKNINLEDICMHCSMSRSLIQKLFKEETGWSVMEYFYRLKIEEAKRQIREETNNFTQIADLLGYSTIHYFSRQFKKIVGMSPSEYSKSILTLAKSGITNQF